MQPSAYFYLGLLFFILLITVFVPLTVRIKVDNWRKANSISVRINLSFFSITRNYSPGNLQKLPRLSDNIQQLISVSFQKLTFINRLLKALDWRYLELRLKIGSGDPAGTAMITGGLNGAFSLVVRYLKNNYSFRERPRFFVYPSFEKKELIFELYFVFKASMVKLLLLSIFLLAYFFAWRLINNAGASNPGLDENSHGKFKRNGRC